jgi:N-sulfoglucosamine sulfohydrolase
MNPDMTTRDRFKQAKFGMMETTRPNILLITTHDSGRHFGCYGVPTVRTPQIDALAADGLLFERMFATAPICSPSRGCLLTGQYPQQNGLIGIAGGGWQWEFDDSRRHLSSVLRDAGYLTTMIGLQHETEEIERLGFEDLSGYGVNAPGCKAKAMLPGWPAGGKGLSAIEVADRTAAFLRRAGHEPRPFFAQVGFFETHTPYAYAGCEPDETLGVWTPPYALRPGVPAWAHDLLRFQADPAAASRHLAALQGSVSVVDTAVGRILAALRETGQEENTLLLFNTDHGVELPGAKWTLYDPGLGIAFILRWPAAGVTGGRRCPWLLSQVDFVPTLLELLHLPAPHPLDGRSFAAALRAPHDNRQASTPRDAIHACWVDGLNFMVRTERHKLIRNLYPVPDSTGRQPPSHELYDLHLDPLERVDVAAEHAYAGVLREMTGRLEDWLRSVNDPGLGGLPAAADLPGAVAEYRRRRSTPREDISEEKLTGDL